MYTEKIKEVVPLPIQKKILSQNQKYPLKQKEDVTQFFKRNSPNIFENKDTGLSDQIKMGIENLSGYSLDDVKVHYNSDKPAQLQALAYTQGTDIYVASGQEKYLPHEAWHVVQQKQGRVYPTIQSNGMNINQDNALEYEADIMGEKALSIQMKSDSLNHQIYTKNTNGTVVQMRDDSVKISADQIGTDPLGLGLTSHHVIPAEILEQFYNFLTIKSTNNIRIRNAFNNWKTNAAQSANATSTIRNGRTVLQESDDYEREVASACQWMSGNIFIGSDPQYRIDDKGDTFDYGGYLYIDKTEKKQKITQIQHINNNMEKLRKIYNAINIVLENGNETTIIEILKELTQIAKVNNTLHKLSVVNSSQRTEAYDIKNWISVGKPQISSIEEHSREFKQMYNYCNSNTEYKELFDKYINGDKVKHLDEHKYIIAKYTYHLLYDKWKK